MKKIISTNPGKNYEIIGEVEASTQQEISEKVKAANESKLAWGMLPIKDRVEYLSQALKLFQSHQKEIVEMINKEIGTPVDECDDEVSWDWEYWQWFLDHADEALSPHTSFENDSVIHQITYEPCGVAAVITPWNLPFDMFVWGVVPNLLAGNTVVYKAAEECVLSGRLYGEIMDQVGLPHGVFSVIHGDAEEGKLLVNTEIDLIWFTGSSAVGKELYALAGRKFIPAVLEMGGSNPAIVCEDADLDLAAKKIVSKRFMFSGQTCDADKRVIVHESVKVALLTKIKALVEHLPVTPIVSAKQLAVLNSQLTDALQKGAQIVVGSDQNNGEMGAYFQPTVLDNVSTHMSVWREEVFGPLLPIITFQTEEEALMLANDTEYGLGSQVFTANQEQANYFARGLQAGNVDVNGVGHWLPQNPFGGYKNSGIGREHGVEGLRELCQIKTISRPK